MKTLASILTVLTLVISASANARVIAQVVVAGGFMSPEVCGTHELRVEDNGRVTFQSCEKNIASLAKLSPKVVAKLMKKIDALHITSLSQPNQRGCMDAPTTYYSVSQRGSEMRAISARVNCIDLEMKSNSYEVTDIRDLLKGLLALSDF